MKIASLAAAVALLAGCSAELRQWRAGTVPAVLMHPAPVSVPKSSPCPPVDPAIEAEAKRLTPIGQAKDVDALTAALMGSEAAKNARLRQAAQAYERCRLAHK